jgi:polyhydroxybutyrate depolymerase
MHFRTAFALLVFGAAAMAAACDEASPATVTTPAGTPPTAAARVTEPPAETATAEPAPTDSAIAGSNPGGAACSLGPAATFPVGETTDAFMTSGGGGRTYLVYVPGSYTGAEAMPLVLNFHGLGSNGLAQHLYSGLVPIAEREGFVLVSPNGVNNSWLITPGANDIQFTRDLVAAISEQLCIDPGAVFATGMSNGGFMSAALACRAGDLVAAVAPVAGVLGATANCGEPVPILQFHGTDDFVVPYAPGIVSATGGPFAGIEVIMASWAEHNGCEGEPTISSAAESVDLIQFAGCDAPTAHYVVNGGGHTWPGGPSVVRLGATTDEISASELMWAFFMEHRR